MSNERGTYGQALYCRDSLGLPPPPRAFDQRGRYGQRAFHGHGAPTYGGGGYRTVDRAVHWGLSWNPPLEIVGKENKRGTYGNGVRSPRTAVGIHWTLHPIGDRTEVVEQLTTEINTLHNELMREMGADPSVMTARVMFGDPMRFSREHAKIEKSPLFPIWRDVFSPFLKEWNDFSLNYSGWTEFLWLTNWEKLVDFKDRWHEIYDKVAKALASHGGKLLAPPPAEIPKDVIDNIEDFFKSAAAKVSEKTGEAWNLAKYGLYAALGIGAVVALASVASNLRKGKDPAESYITYASRGAARGAEAVAIP